MVQIDCSDLWFRFILRDTFRIHVRYVCKYIYIHKPTHALSLSHTHKYTYAHIRIHCSELVLFSGIRFRSVLGTYKYIYMYTPHIYIYTHTYTWVSFILRDMFLIRGEYVCKYMYINTPPPSLSHTHTLIYIYTHTYTWVRCILRDTFPIRVRYVYKYMYMDFNTPTLSLTHTLSLIYIHTHTYTWVRCILRDTFPICVRAQHTSRLNVMPCGPVVWRKVLGDFDQVLWHVYANGAREWVHEH